MPLINRLPVVSDKLVTLTRDFLLSEQFTHQDWSCDELEEFRSFIREFMRTEQNGFCAYCSGEISLNSAQNCHVEHIAPKSLHREFIFELKNLCVVCADCNTVKRNQETINEVPETIVNPIGRVRYPNSTNSFLIVHPHIDEYDHHIVRFGPHIYIGKTRKGEFTVIACDLNRYIKKFDMPTSTLNMDALFAMFNKIMENDNPLQQGLLIGQLAALLTSRNN